MRGSLTFEGEKPPETSFEFVCVGAAALHETYLRWASAPRCRGQARANILKQSFRKDSRLAGLFRNKSRKVQQHLLNGRKADGQIVDDLVVGHSSVFCSDLYRSYLAWASWRASEVEEMA